MVRQQCPETFQCLRHGPLIQVNAVQKIPAARNSAGVDDEIKIFEEKESGLPAAAAKAFVEQAGYMIAFPAGTVGGETFFNIRIPARAPVSGGGGIVNNGTKAQLSDFLHHTEITFNAVFHHGIHRNVPLPGL